MHPFEHLRYVARARNADPVEVARDAAYALGSLVNDPFNLVLACRRLLQRQPGSAPLWWLASQLVTSDRPGELVWELTQRLGADDCADMLADTLPADARVASLGWSQAIAVVAAERDDVRLLRAIEVDLADIVVIEALAVCERRLLAEPGSAALAEAARTAGIDVWCVVEEGRRVPLDYFDLIAAAPGGAEDVEVSLVTHLVTATEVSPRRDGDLAPDCPFAAELLRRSAI
jgi:hypothetical protein